MSAEKIRGFDAIATTIFDYKNSKSTVIFPCISTLPFPHLTQG
ncbi:hypothetical protein PL11201_730083 [Planktothrix sp. PCC 11201]|nr:hypothetical protein PL11201_730083 [Planktothrix sp. PCC 11201]